MCAAKLAAWNALSPLNDTEGTAMLDVDAKGPEGRQSFPHAAKRHGQGIAVQGIVILPSEALVYQQRRQGRSQLHEVGFAPLSRATHGPKDFEVFKTGLPSTFGVA